jgi:hypothetical protein
MNFNGLELKNFPLKVGAFELNVPILSLSAFGVVAVLLCSWMYLTKEMTVEVRRKIKQRKFAVEIKMVKSAGIVFGAFTISLFLPYILESNLLASVTSVICAGNFQMQQFSIKMYNVTTPLRELEPLWKYVISQNVSSFMAVIASAIFARKYRSLKESRRK